MALVEPREVPSLVEWAPQHLRLPVKETRLAGPFSFEYSPYLREPCEWFCDPYVREITLMACLQGGKTLYTLLCLSWLIEFAPAHAMVVMTDEHTLRRRMRRLRPTFEENPFLLRKLGGEAKNLHIGEPTDLPQMQLYLSWSNSAATMADVPVCYIFADEIALWETSVGVTEVDALSHLRGRQSTFNRDSKLVKISSPENVGDLLDTEFNDGDQCEYWVTCHYCGYSHVMTWHDKDDPKVYAILDRPGGEWLHPRDYERGRHVRYLCPSCGKVWSDYARAAAVAEGRWLPAGVTMGRAGKVEGEIRPAVYKSAHIHGLMVHPRLRSLGKMAAEWVRAQHARKAGSTGRLKRFLNAECGQSWRETAAVTDETRLRRHIDLYASGTVPRGVQAVTISIDVHDNWFRVAVFGWGYLYEGWLLEALRIETEDTREMQAYEPLRPLLARPWQAADGMYLVPSAVVIDCGYRPEPVKNFCREYRHMVHRGNLIPVRGSPRRLMRAYVKIAADPVLNLYELNPVQYKDQAWRVLFEAQQPGPGYLHLPADIQGDVIVELCSEHKLTVKGRPVWAPKRHLDNHTWDCLYYALFAAQLIGVGLMRPLPGSPPPRAEPATPSERTARPGKIRSHYD